MKRPRRPPPPGTPAVPLRLWGARLREARRARGLTQPQLAAMAGVAQQSVSKMERGESCPHDRVKLQLARALGVNPGTLFPWPGPAET